MAYIQYYGGGVKHSEVWVDIKGGKLHIQKSVKCLFDNCTIFYDRDAGLLKIENKGDIIIKDIEKEPYIAIKKINNTFGIWKKDTIKDLTIVRKTKDFIEIKV